MFNRIIFLLYTLAKVSLVYSQESKYIDSNILGYWKVINVFTLDKNDNIDPVLDDELASCVNGGIYFSRDSILSSQGNCMHGVSCFRPEYTMSKMLVAKAFGNKNLAMQLGYAKNDVLVVHATNCNHVLFDDIVMINDQTLLTAADGYIYVLKKQKGKFNININYIKVNKCFLYNLPEDTAKTKAYLIKGDKVEILDNKIEWLKILFISPKTNKSFVKWIKAGVL